MAYTFLFPGQGSQKVGMGKDLAEAFPFAKQRFAAADELLGRDIGRICFEGPEDALKDTRNTQPALFVVESIISDALKEKGIEPRVCAGHSLGEYSALYSAGVISFEGGLKLVSRRGELMSTAGEKKPGAMAAIVGLEAGAVAEAIAGVDSGVVVCANENAPAQTVISGEKQAVADACEKCSAAGARRAVTLPVSGAFHSPLMQEAADAFSAVLSTVSFSDPQCAVVANVSGTIEKSGQRLKELLLQQLVSPVKWVATMETLVSQDATHCLETGPGNVLRGLAKKFGGNLTVVSCESAENIYSIVDGS